MAEHTETWHVAMDEFDEPEFYPTGPLLTLVAGDRTVVVEGEGKRCLEKPGAALCTPEEFRAAFPDGTVPGDGETDWEWQHNGWFCVYDNGEPSDEVTYSLREAVDEARDLLAGHDR